MPETALAKERILVIDDDAHVLELLGRILGGAGYRFVLAGDAEQAYMRLAEAPFDLMLCDVQLPGDSGIELVEHVLARHAHTAAVMISGLDDVALADQALAVGAYGYLVKPFTGNDVLRSVLGALSRRRHELDVEAELRASREETIQRLCIAVEARDPDTARHIGQMSELCGRVARQLGLPAEHCELIRVASAMHDVGKVGIPDRILLKPGALTPEERAVMETHAEIGYRILVGSRSELLQLAALIAYTHHERYGGGGYPRGVAGSAIPLEGRIAAAADVYDALTRDRVYRPRLSHEQAIELLEQGRGTQFDPEVLDALLTVVEGPRAPPGGVPQRDLASG